MSTIIKAGSYCPVCKGMFLEDCRHEAHEFLHSYFTQNQGLRSALLREQLVKDELFAALTTLDQFASAGSGYIGSRLQSIVRAAREKAIDAMKRETQS